jgi:hypothetical protein
MKFAKTVSVMVGTLAAVICVGAQDVTAEDLGVLGCVNPAGQVRIVTDGRGCKNQEFRLQFNTVPELGARLRELETRLPEVENCLAENQLCVDRPQ